MVATADHTVPPSLSSFVMTSSNQGEHRIEKGISDFARSVLEDEAEKYVRGSLAFPLVENSVCQGKGSVLVIVPVSGVAAVFEWCVTGVPGMLFVCVQVLPGPLSDARIYRRQAIHQQTE